MALVTLSALLLLALPAGARQPITAQGAVESSEKLEGKTTPIQMVIGLLKDLTAKVEEQGKVEAAAYDKFACFCKEEADEKLYAIETSDKKIKKLTAEIEELEAALGELAEEISELSKKIADLEADITKLDEDRAAEHETYEGNAAELDAAVSAVERASAALDDAKKSMGGKAQVEAFAQVKTSIARVTQKGFFVITPDQQQALNELLLRGARKTNVRHSQDPYSSEFHSNEVIDMLDELRKDLIDQKNSLDTAEFEAKKLYDNERLSKANEKQFSEEDKAEKEKEAGDKTAKKETAEQLKDVETKAKKADDEFLKVLTEECEEKAMLWDQRSKSRADELKALAEATEALETGAAPNAQEGMLQTHRAPSFLQVHGRRESDKRQKVMHVLDAASARLHSAELSMASLRVQASDDHFVKVRQLMKDLIARLEEEAAREADQKEMCDKEMKKAVTARDEAMVAVETDSKDKAIKEADSKQLKMDVAQLAKDVAANKKALMEATELRAEEKADNEKVIAESTEGLAAVKKAIEILSAFYQGTGFLQKRSGYVPPNSDRDGKTVGDKAPEVFDDTYDGQQEASKGIIGALQVIQSDFERVISQTEEAESRAEGEFKEFKDSNEADTLEKEEDKSSKEESLTVTNDAILSLETSLGEVKSEHKAALKALDALKDSCVEKEETFEERMMKREQEIEALKEALAILEDWDKTE